MLYKVEYKTVCDVQWETNSMVEKMIKIPPPPPAKKGERFGKLTATSKFSAVVNC